MKSIDPSGVRTVTVPRRSHITRVQPRRPCERAHPVVVSASRCECPSCRGVLELRPAAASPAYRLCEPWERPRRLPCALCLAERVRGQQLRAAAPEGMLVTVDRSAPPTLAGPMSWIFGWAASGDLDAGLAARALLAGPSYVGAPLDDEPRARARGGKE